MPATINAIPAFTDNYIWLLTGGDTRAAVVDPGDAGPVLEALRERRLELDTILVTHHHHDHTGGIAALVEATGARVIGPRSDRIPHTTATVGEGDVITVLDIPFQVFEVPGHTLDHIAFYANSQATGNHPVLFCGDTLFAGGCGRLFEGTPGQMLDSLEKIATLPADSAIYCAHEYTQNNLRFALAAEPGNQALAERAARVNRQRDHGEITLPSTLGVEKDTNPFLRCHLPALREALADAGHGPCTDTVTTFAALRRWKDNF